MRFTALSALVALGENATAAYGALLEVLGDSNEHLFFRMRILALVVNRKDLREPLFHLLRNKVDDAAESRLFRVRAGQVLAAAAAEL